MKNCVKCGTMVNANIRNRLKSEIMSLTDAQVEYVMRRMRDVQDEKSIEVRGGNLKIEK